MNRLSFLLALVVTVSGALSTGCAKRNCLEQHRTVLTTNQVMRRDGELLTELVAHRRGAAEELQAMSEGSSERDSAVFSIQAWEMAIALIVQLQNLTRDEENQSSLAENIELTSEIRCSAWSWIERETNRVRTRDGQNMLMLQRELETHYQTRGRPTDSQLTAICEGREIYMGPVEEDEAPVAEPGTGPRTNANGDEEVNEVTNQANSAVEDLLGDDETDDDE